MLNLTTLQASIVALDNAVLVTLDLGAYPSRVQDTLKAGVIQSFEVAYEQSWKMVQRWLAVNGGEEVSGITRRQLFRLAAHDHLIDDVDLWMRFNHSRNLTSHTYDAAVAQEVLDLAPVFLVQAKCLLAALELRND